MIRSRVLLAVAVAAASILAAGTAQAGSVTFTNTAVDDQGTGFGNVTNVLTVQKNGSEWGSVTWDGTNVIKGTAGDNTKSNSDSPTVGEIQDTWGGDLGTELGIVFNISQEGNDIDITLHDFDVLLFNADGSLNQTLTYTAPVGGLTLNMVGNGSGGAGWLFRLSGINASWIADEDNRMGFRITQANAITDSNDGQDNFYVGTFALPAVAPLPPAVWTGLVGLGAFGLWSLRRRRQSAQLV